MCGMSILRIDRAVGQNWQYVVFVRAMAVVIVVVMLCFLRMRIEAEARRGFDARYETGD